MISSGLFRVVIIFMIPGLVSSAQAFEISQLQWDTGATVKLHRGEVFTYKWYSIEAVIFPPPVESDRYKDIPAEPVEAYVGLNISKNGSFIDTAVLGLEESYILPDGELKVTAKQLPSKTASEWLYESYAPWATIELSPRGTPVLEVLVETDKDKYSSSSEIAATVQLENTGTADAINVDMRIDTELPIRKGSLKYHYDRVKKGESVTETITFSSPLLLEQKDYGILANVSSYDAKDIYYTAEHQKIITIAAEPEQGLSIRKSANNRIYLKDYAMISLSLENNRNENLKNVSISDSLPKNFKLAGNITLHWVVDIPAGGDWDFRYLVKPQEPNKDGIVLPSATAEYKIRKELYRIRSTQPRIRVYGPKIVLMKYTNVSEIEPNETAAVLTVTVTAENTGNTPTKVLIKDRLPENATIASGNTTREEFLEANRKVSFNYSVIIESAPPIRLPPASADYYELGAIGEKISVSSNEPVIGIRVPATTPETDVTASPVNGS